MEGDCRLAVSDALVDLLVNLGPHTEPAGSQLGNDLAPGLLVAPRCHVVLPPDALVMAGQACGLSGAV